MVADPSELRRYRRGSGEPFIPSNERHPAFIDAGLCKRPIVAHE